MILFLDSSALIKNYVREAGTGAMQTKLRATEIPFASQITFAECLYAFQRKFKSGELDRAAFQQASDEFLRDWKTKLSVLEVDAKTMASVPALVTSLRSADAIQLSSALWLGDAGRLGPQRPGRENAVEFAASDEHLLEVAARWGLQVFNPTTA